MADTPWMPMWWADYLADTRHLSTEEHGAYMLLIGAYWMAGAPLVDDDKRLARITGLTLRKWKSVRPVLEEFFTIEQKKWSSKRINDELLVAKSKHIKRVEAGKKGGGSRGKSEQNQGQNPSNASSELQANDKQSPSNVRGNSQSQSQSHIPKDNKLSSGGSDDPDDLKNNDEKWLWSDGLAHLNARSPDTEKSIRSMLGEWLKSFEASDIRQAILTSQVSCTNNPISYCLRTLQNRHADIRAGVPKFEPEKPVGLSGQSLADAMKARAEQC